MRNAESQASRNAGSSPWSIAFDSVDATWAVSCARRYVRLVCKPLQTEVPTDSEGVCSIQAALAASHTPSHSIGRSWRPVTAIQRGDTDGNPRIEADPAWEPLIVTPTFSEYPSGHACATAAVAHTIEDFFQHEVYIPARNVVSGEERFYRRASDAVDEVVEARMLVGIHFRSGDEDGADIGRKVARQIRRNWIKGKH